MSNSQLEIRLIIAIYNTFLIAFSYWLGGGGEVVLK